MPELTQDQLNKLNGNGKQTQQPTATATTATTEETSAIATLAKTTAGTIRRSAGVVGKLADAAQQQRELVTDHEADRLAQILDPVSIQAEIAVKTLQKLEGKDFLPFDLEPIELPEVQRYVPQLPQSYAVAALSSSSTSNNSPTSASDSETISNGNSKTPAGTGFGEQRKAS